MTLSRKQFGPALWIVSIQYFITQALVALSWATSFSWTANTISDLGNTACGTYGAMYVCSPHHAIMNGSFIIQGFTMLIGAILIRKLFAPSKVVTFGFSCMALAGIGTILVGLFPENTVSSLHILGAGLPFVLGNLGMLVISAKLLKLPAWLRIYGIFSGAIGLLGLAAFLSHLYLGLGIGGMERVVAYPQTIWMIIFGIHQLRFCLSE